MKKKITKKTPREVLEETGYAIYADESVLKNAPTGEIQKVEFFNIGKWVSRKELEKEYTDRGLVPANLNSLAAVCDEHQYTATIWGDKCYLAFDEWYGDRKVYCNRRGGGWGGYWFLAGVSAPGKSSPKTSETQDKSLRILTLIREIEERLAKLKTLI